jgi:hypothetical protein
MKYTVRGLKLLVLRGLKLLVLRGLKLLVLRGLKLLIHLRAQVADDRGVFCEETRSAYASIHQHTPAYASILPLTPAYVRIPACRSSGQGRLVCEEKRSALWHRPRQRRTARSWNVSGEALRICMRI